MEVCRREGREEGRPYTRGSVGHRPFTPFPRLPRLPTLPPPRPTSPLAWMGTRPPAYENGESCPAGPLHAPLASCTSIDDADLSYTRAEARTGLRSLRIVPCPARA